MKIKHIVLLLLIIISYFSCDMKISLIPLSHLDKFAMPKYSYNDESLKIINSCKDIYNLNCGNSFNLSYDIVKNASDSIPYKKLGYWPDFEEVQDAPYTNCVGKSIYLAILFNQATGIKGKFVIQRLKEKVHIYYKLPNGLTFNKLNNYKDQFIYTYDQAIKISYYYEDDSLFLLMSNN